MTIDDNRHDNKVTIFTISKDLFSNDAHKYRERDGGREREGKYQLYPFIRLGFFSGKLSSFVFFL